MVGLMKMGSIPSYSFVLTLQIEGIRMLALGNQNHMFIISKNIITTKILIGFVCV